MSILARMHQPDSCYADRAVDLRSITLNQGAPTMPDTDLTDEQRQHLFLEELDLMIESTQEFIADDGRSIDRATDLHALERVREQYCASNSLHEEPVPPFTEEERQVGLLEIITSDDGPTLERMPHTELKELACYEDEGALWSLSPVTAHWERDGHDGHDYTDCTVVWRADVDGLHARCTLLSSDGTVLAQWEAHGNA